MSGIAPGSVPSGEKLRKLAKSPDLIFATACFSKIPRDVAHFGVVKNAENGSGSGRIDRIYGGELV